jgi:2-polyprenyl-3-methyl-5-hydroxy-6-metoxy-1,4-benzoquinol methylase
VKSLYLQWTLGPFLEKTGGITLDAGCGSTAPLTRLLARRFSTSRFMGLDLKPRVPQSHPPNLWLCVGDLRVFPAAGPFDMIYCIDVLEHLENVEACICDFARCLTPGGYMFLHVPSRHQRHFLPGVDLEYSWLGPGEPGDAHIWEGFEPEQLETWLSKAGCQVLLSRFTFGMMTTILKELFMLGEARRIPGVGLGLFPFLVFAAWFERRLGGRSGNGLLILARKVDVSGEGKG